MSQSGKAPIYENHRITFLELGKKNYFASYPETEAHWQTSKLSFQKIKWLIGLLSYMDTKSRLTFLPQL